MNMKKRMALIDRSWRYTDFISDYQKLLCWGFDYRGLKAIADIDDYSDPVRKAMFAALKEIADSGNKFIRSRHFTIFMGDYGDENQYFWIGIRWSTSGRIIDIFNRHFTPLRGFEFMECAETPWIPLIPMYRYEYGKVVQYIFEYAQAGKRSIDLDYGTGLKMIYRLWESAEGFDMRQKYRG